MYIKNNINLSTLSKIRKYRLNHEIIIFVHIKKNISHSFDDFLLGL